LIAIPDSCHGCAKIIDLEKNELVINHNALAIFGQYQFKLYDRTVTCLLFSPTNSNLFVATRAGIMMMETTNYSKYFVLFEGSVVQTYLLLLQSYNPFFRILHVLVCLPKEILLLQKLTLVR